MNCDYCGALLVEPLLWRGRVFAMEDKDGVPVRHLCPALELPAPNERWFGENMELVGRTVPEVKATFQPSEDSEPLPPPEWLLKAKEPAHV